MACVWDPCEVVRLAEGDEGDGGHLLRHKSRLDILAREVDEQNVVCVWDPCGVDGDGGCVHGIQHLPLLADRMGERHVGGAWERSCEDVRCGGNVRGGVGVPRQVL